MKRWIASAALVFVIAVVVNYAWELGQSQLYAGQDDFRTLLWHCLRAAGGDGIWVLVIFAGGALVTRRPGWHVHPGRGGYLWMLSAGLLIGAAVEWLAVHVARRWIYEPGMPMIPGLQIGVVPVFQMLVLPPLIFRIASAWRARHCSAGR